MKHISGNYQLHNFGLHETGCQNNLWRPAVSSSFCVMDHGVPVELMRSHA